MLCDDVIQLINQLPSLKSNMSSSLLKVLNRKYLILVAVTFQYRLATRICRLSDLRGWFHRT